MAIPEVTTGADVIDVAANLPVTVNLTASATNAPTSYQWTMLGIPLNSAANAGVNGDFNNGISTVQNPQFDADTSGTYVCLCVATNIDGPSDPENDDTNAIQLGKVRSSTSKLEVMVPSRKQLDYDDELNELLDIFETELARNPRNLNILNYGAARDGVTDDYAAFLAAVAAAVAQSATLVIPAGTYLIDQSLTIGSGAHLHFQPGSVLEINTGSTLTLDCHVEAGAWQIFAGAGTIVGTALRNTEIRAEWFGVVPGIDVATTLATLLASIGPKKRILFREGTYTLSSGVTVSEHYTQLVADNDGAVVINAAPTANMTAVKFEKSAGATELFGVGLKGFTFSSGDSTYEKIAVELSNVRGCKLEKFITADSSWNGASSVGLKVAGRGDITVHDCEIHADKPIVFAPNPDASENDCEYVHLNDLVLDCQEATESVVEIEDATVVKNLKIDGRQRWTGGTNGLKFVDTTGVTASGMIVVENVEHRDEAGTGGYAVNIANATQVNTVLLRNVLSAGANSSGGFFVNDADVVVLDGCRHDGGVGTTALSIDAVNNLTLLNTHLEALSTVAVSNMTELLRTPLANASDVDGVTAIYVIDTAEPFISQSDFRTYKISTLIADSADFDLPIGSPAYNVMRVEVSAVDTTTFGGTDEEAGTWLVSKAGNATQLVGTTNAEALTGAGSPNASKLTLWRETDALVHVSNRLGDEILALIKVEIAS